MCTTIKDRDFVSRLLLKHGYRDDEAKEIINCMYTYYQMKGNYCLKLLDLE
jgi:hypothetical protein